MSWADKATLLGLFVLTGAAIAIVIELRLKHHLGRLGMLAESLDSQIMPLRAKIESQGGHIATLRHDLTRLTESHAETKAKVEVVYETLGPWRIKDAP